MGKWVSLLAGGVAGTAARYALSGWVHRWLGAGFPYGTLAVNVLGCFLVGVFAALAEEKFLLSPNARVLLMAGFCGAFTTFSTLIFETGNLLKDGEMLAASVNVVVSIVAGLAAFRVGVLIVRAL